MLWTFGHDKFTGIAWITVVSARVRSSHGTSKNRIDYRAESGVYYFYLYSYIIHVNTSYIYYVIYHTSQVLTDRYTRHLVVSLMGWGVRRRTYFISFSRRSRIYYLLTKTNNEGVQ